MRRIGRERGERGGYKGGGEYRMLNGVWLTLRLVVGPGEQLSFSFSGWQYVAVKLTKIGLSSANQRPVPG
jgi:hypothetical protein